MLSVEDVSAFYGSAQALFDVSMALEESDSMAIIGPNGAGKSTLLDCITGNKEFEGTIRFREESVADLDPWEIADHVGYCTEKRNLFKDMSVEQNLRLGAFSNPDETRANMDRVYELFPRLEERHDQLAKTMSGGEQQMLAIGRALMTDPSLLVLDEPSLGLAPTIIADISETLDRIMDEGITVLIAEQNVTFATDHAEQLVLLESGVVQAAGDTATLQAEDDLQKAYFGSASS